MCARAWRGCAPRTQASVAVSANGEDWVLLNASPDLRQQINETTELQPAAGKGQRATARSRPWS